MMINNVMRLEYFVVALTLVPLLLGAIVYRLWWYRAPVYTYSLAHYVAHTTENSAYFRWVFFILRVLILGLLLFLIAKPQRADHRSYTTVEGIDIMLTLDVSGSMACFDDIDDRRSRIQIAKKEALAFIEARTNDAIGLVVFGNGVLSACPLTHDKAVLTEIIQQLDIGTMVDDRSTLLAHGLLAALNRLKVVQSPSKIIILLTDGQPSINDVPIQVPLTIAQQLGVKIYTIGVGNERGGFVRGPQGMILAEGVQLNEQLLAYIAQQTGGVFYRARTAKQVHEIYSAIDALEKRKSTIPVCTRYVDIFVPIVILVLLLLTLELVLYTVVWRQLG
jgi:Ca-activated chloride channel family protein